jgi:hypothetical protein
MILKLLRQNGVLAEGEYQAAMASELNIAGMQRKVDQSVITPPVFTTQSSTSIETVKNPFLEEKEKQGESEKIATPQPVGVSPIAPTENQTESK